MNADAPLWPHRAEDSQSAFHAPAGYNRYRFDSGAICRASAAAGAEPTEGAPSRGGGSGLRLAAAKLFTAPISSDCDDHGESGCGLDGAGGMGGGGSDPGLGFWDGVDSLPSGSVVSLVAGASFF